MKFRFNFQGGRIGAFLSKHRPKKPNIPDLSGLKNIPIPSLGSFIGGFIVILVGLSLFPSISKLSDESSGSMMNTNVSISINSPAGTMMKLTGVVWVLAVVTGGIAIAYLGLRNGGMV